MIGSVTTSGRLPPSSLATPVPRRVLPMAEEGLFLPTTEEGFFLGLGLWPNVDIDMGLLVFYPPQYGSRLNYDLTGMRIVHL